MFLFYFYFFGPLNITLLRIAMGRKKKPKSLLPLQEVLSVIRTFMTLSPQSLTLSISGRNSGSGHSRTVHRSNGVPPLLVGLPLPWCFYVILWKPLQKMWYVEWLSADPWCQIALVLIPTLTPNSHVTLNKFTVLSVRLFLKLILYVVLCNWLFHLV